MDDGQIVVLPSSLYTVDDGELTFPNVAHESFFNILDKVNQKLGMKNGMHFFSFRKF